MRDARRPTRGHGGAARGGGPAVAEGRGGDGGTRDEAGAVEGGRDELATQTLADRPAPRPPAWQAPATPPRLACHMLRGCEESKIDKDTKGYWSRENLLHHLPCEGIEGVRDLAPKLKELNLSEMEGLTSLPPSPRAGGAADARPDPLLGPDVVVDRRLTALRRARLHRAGSAPPPDVSPLPTARKIPSRSTTS